MREVAAALLLFECFYPKPHNVNKDLILPGIGSAHAALAPTNRKANIVVCKFLEDARRRKI